MPPTLQRLLLGLPIGLSVISVALAQPAAVAPEPAAPPPQTPPQFQLNQIELALLNQVLAAWENQSAKVATFRCPFERWEYNAAFGPGPDLPLHKDQGELTYQKPDKGSFQITEVRKWQAEPTPPGEQPPAQAKGDWVAQPNAIGEHWVCDGKAIYEYRHDQKQLVERPIPPEMQGQAIVDGPLPFLFGAEAAKLKQRYWMRIDEQPNDQEIWLTAQPRFQADAANYQAVRLILDRQQLLPKAMEVLLPDQSRHVYLFDLANASVNGTLDRIQALFSRPKTPWGWQRVVEEGEPAATPPTRQAAQPGKASPK